MTIIDFSEEDISDHKLYEKNIPEEIKIHVLERDAWACRSCNDDSNLHPHHIWPRWMGRDHHPDNLVTLCFDCHRRIHDGTMKIAVVNGNFFFGGEKRWG